MLRRTAAAVVLAALVAACGSDTAFVTGDDRRALQAPMPTDAPAMRADLAAIEDTLASAAADPGQAGAKDGACTRLFNLMQEMREGFSRYDLSKEAYRLLSVAYSECDEAPGAAADNVQAALDSAPQATSEQSGPDS